MFLLSPLEQKAIQFDFVMLIISSNNMTAYGSYGYVGPDYSWVRAN